MQKTDPKVQQKLLLFGSSIVIIFYFLVSGKFSLRKAESVSETGSSPQVDR